MNILSIDIETYSSVDLRSCGVYAYTAAPDFTILLFGYSYNNEPVKVIDLAQGEKIPFKILQALISPNVIKTAYNANFERTCLSRYLQTEMPPEQWRCTAVHAAYLGLPSTLDDVAKALKLDENKQKMNEGAALIRYFCIPKKPRADKEIENQVQLNIRHTIQYRNLPEDVPDKWEKLKEYCKRDVEVEKAIKEKLEAFPVPKSEQELWELDQKINDRGVLIDKILVKNAIKCDQLYSDKLIAEAAKLTSLDNPNSVSQLKNWLAETEGEEVKSLNKKTVSKLIEKTENNITKRVLKLRREMSKTSIKKYDAMLRSIGPDNRIRGLLQFYGANRTGRWASRLVQVQNLPQNKLNDLTLARRLVKEGKFEALELLFDSVPDTLSQLIRTAFIPSPGRRFIVADFSAIEARVIAWLAGEKWRMDVFKSHGKIYEASAAQMFRVPVESINKGNPLRQKGKIAELALGYQGGKGALIQMGALDMGLDEEELPELVNAWRNSNQNIVKLWYKVENAAIKAVQDKTTVNLSGPLEFKYKEGVFFITLPSRRHLSYIRPRITRDLKFNKFTLSYEGIDQTKQWARIPTYGGKLVENIVQAIARDCLAVALKRLDKAGFQIAFHVHDEVVLDVPKGHSSPEEVARIISQPIEWAKGLPLQADAFETDFYKKD